MTLRIVVLGLSITSSWGNGHATTYRGLLRALDEKGHDVTFLERDVPWYRDHRDMPDPPFGETFLYSSIVDLEERFGEDVRTADAVIIGSYVPEGIKVADWVFQTTGGVTLFYDIDTPVTLTALEEGSCEYLRPSLIPRYDAYLSFTGGPVLERLRVGYGARLAVPLYCSVDPRDYPAADERDEEYALGYLGTYSTDRQPSLQRLLLDPARQRPDLRFAVAGPQFPDSIDWPKNVARRDHVPPAEHAGFYHSQAFTLNITRTDMVRVGYAPSVRLFEAAATGTPIMSDVWPGLETFFRPGEEILLVDSAKDVLRHLDETSEEERRALGERARARVLRDHTPADRAAALESVVRSLMERRLAHV